MKLKNKINKNLAKVVADEGIMLFPEFIFYVRLAYGQTRKGVAKDLKITPQRLFILENGTFEKVPKKRELDSISEYYEVDREILQEKADFFVAKDYVKYFKDPKGKKCASLS